MKNTIKKLWNRHEKEILIYFTGVAIAGVIILLDLLNIIVLC